MICLMKREKYNSLPLEDRDVLESLSIDGVEVLNIRIKNPNNPVKLVEAKMLVFKILRNKVRKRFPERYGFKKVRDNFQIDSMNKS